MEAMSDTPESWLSCPVDGVNAYLMPVAHALVQARRDLGEVTANLTVEELWDRPGGAASIGFHLHHVAGVLDRLCTYARGEELGTEQMRTLRREGQRGEPPADAAALLREARAAIDASLDQVRATDFSSLLEPRLVGRKRLPSTVLGLLYHAAEHATRHTGQIVTTARILRGAAWTRP
jgi:uncharacterized damage-inducible protein DinB